ncbi:MAG: hypothetical protein AAF492_30135, partial [Verrucomicrobiota bacterium]
KEGSRALPKKLKKVKAIACGHNVSMALHEDGNVTIWGRDHFLRMVPNNLENIKAISAGEFVQLCLEEDGTVHAWGHYMYKDERFPSSEQLSGVKGIAAGSNRMFVLKEDGEVVGSHSSGADTPSKPDDAKKIAEIAAGTRVGCILLTEKGKVIQWIGTESGERITKAIAIRAGGDMYAAQMMDKTWKVWGRAPKAEEMAREIEKLGPLKDLAFGRDRNEGYFIAIK